MLKATLQLGALARRHGIALRQSYVRVARRAALMAGRYVHAKQFKQANRELRFLRTRLGRLIRDAEVPRTYPSVPADRTFSPRCSRRIPIFQDHA